MLHQAFLLGTRYEMDFSGEITSRLFENINVRFHKSSRITKYLTMIYGEIAGDGTFRFLSAAHPLPRIFSREFDRFVEINPDHLTIFPPSAPCRPGGTSTRRTSPLPWATRTATPPTKSA